MWTNDKYRQDIRAVVTLLLRINLAPKRFFKPKKKYDKEESKKTKIRKNVPKSVLMETLFELLVKFQKGSSKYNKLHSIKKTIQKLFNANVATSFSKATDKDSMGVDSNKQELGSKGISYLSQYSIK